MAMALSSSPYKRKRGYREQRIGSPSHHPKAPTRVAATFTTTRKGGLHGLRPHTSSGVWCSMSIKAMNWVMDNSPYSSDRYVVHLILADIANDGHGQEIYINQEKLAKRCRITRPALNRIMGQMVVDGFLVDTGKRTGKTNSITVWQVVFPPLEAVTLGYTFDGSCNPNPPEAVTLGEVIPTYTNSINTSETQNENNTQSDNEDGWSTNPVPHGMPEAKFKSGLAEARAQLVVLEPESEDQ